MSPLQSPARNIGIAIALALLAPLVSAAVSGGVGPRVHGLIDVPPGGDLQAALDAAQPGDTIQLTAGATYTGQFILPAKNGTAEILVRTSAPDSALPPPGRRISPPDFSALAKVSAGGGSVFAAASGAGHYRFLGLEISPTPGSFLYNVIVLGGGSEGSVAAQPHDIAFERCYIHGDPLSGSRRGIAMNGRSLTVVDSRLSDFKEVGADSQAIAGWSGAGPFTIVNNYLEGAGENVMFGGADPSLPGLVPADIVVRHNHFYKPLTWKADDANYSGTHWSVKNLFELKNARRVLIEGNVFEHNWADAQSGFAILFTVRNQDGTAPWSQVDHVAFHNNILRHVGAGFNVLGYDNNFPSAQTNNLSILNNVAYDLTDARWNGNGAFLQVLDATADVVSDHNTVIHTGNVITADGRPHSRFAFTNNIAAHNAYGIIGTNHGPGNDSIGVYFPGGVFRRNAIPGAAPTAYPADNFYPATMNDVGFVDLAGGNYRLAASSPHSDAGTDGRDVGADVDAVDNATCGVVNGTYCSSSNRAPSVPLVTGPSTGGIGRRLSFAVRASDADGDLVKYTVDWGDGTRESSGFVPSDSTAPFFHTWSTAGTYNVSAWSEDARGSTSQASPPVTVAVAGQSGPTWFSGMDGALLAITGALAFGLLIFALVWRRGGPREDAAGDLVSPPLTWWSPLWRHAWTMGRKLPKGGPSRAKLLPSEVQNDDEYREQHPEQQE